MKRKTNADYYKDIQKKILDMLNKNELPPWRKPWKAGSGLVGGPGFIPMNLARGEAYRGINVWLLLMEQWDCGYSTNCWVTYKQAAELAARQARQAGREIEEITKTTRKGYKKTTYIDTATGERPGGVRAGEKGTKVLLWKPIKKKETDKDTGEERKSRYLLVRSYTVFNIDQCDGVQVPEPEEDAAEFDPIEEAQAIADGYFDRAGAPKLRHGGNQACYIPSFDRIEMPKPKTFVSREEYYSTLFHEAAHSTGHKSRLDRDLHCLAGVHQYSEEELVAEFAACFLSGVSGIAQPVLENSAAYIKGWRSRLVNSDPKIVVMAAQRAQKAADLIMGEVREYQKSEAA